MSDYSRLYDFSVKDSLPSGNAAKKIKGVEIDGEYDAIVTMSQSKSNKVSGATNGNLAGLDSGGDLTDSGYDVKDEDDLVSDSATTVPTQQSVKAYVDRLESVAYSGRLCPHANLVVSYATAATFSIAADTVILSDGTEMRGFNSLSETVDITASGANGLDTGSEANNTWYYIWAVAKPDGTLDGLLSTSSSAPTLPIGYTFQGLLGAVFNDGASNFVETYQRNRAVATVTTTELSGGTATTATSITLTGVPAEATTWLGQLRQDNNSGAGIEMAITVSPDSSANTGKASIGGYVLDNQSNQGMVTIPIITANTMYYLLSSASTDGNIFTIGWEW